MPTRRDHLQPKGPRPFTNREDKIDRFLDLFHHLQDREYNVLSFYGVGGVGKSRLRQELIEKVRNGPWAKDTIISSSLDFDTRDNRPSLRNVERALLALRTELRLQKIPFRAFDIAYAHYWERTHPEVALQHKDIPFINEGSAIIDLFGGGKDLIESWQKFSTWIDGAGLLPKVLTLLTSLEKAGRQWLTKRTVEQLRQLNNIGVGQLLDELVYFLAYDIRDYLETNDRRLVVFIDTYEALWWDAPHNRSVEHWLEQDKWVRNLVAELPHTLWVIGGRNQLRWEEIDDWGQYVNEILMGELSATDSGRYLAGCGLSDSAIINRILSSSQGLPFALELQVDQYERILKTRKPTVDDFAEYPDDLLRRFTEYLTLQELQTLKVLSVARVWNPSLFLELIRYFQTGYPATALPELSLFSFIRKEGDQYRMHNLMRDELRSRLDDSVKTECNQVIFDYYNKQLNQLDFKAISLEQEFAIEEALYHQLNLNQIEHSTDWLFTHIDNFNKGSRWALCFRLLFEVQKVWQLNLNNKSHEKYNQVLQYLGDVYYQQGQYEPALEYYQQVLKIRQAELGEQHPNTATTLNSIGDVYDSQGQYERALAYYQQALVIRQAELGEQHPDTATTLNSMGDVYDSQGQYERALAYYQQALVIRQAKLDEQHPDMAITLNNIGLVFSNQGQYERALEYYQQALGIWQAVQGEQHPDTAIALNNIGLVYDHQGQYERALGYYQQALGIWQAVMGEQHPNTATTLNNMGHIYDNQGQYDRALEYYQRALKIRQAVLGEQHPDTATTLNNIGRVHDNQGQYERALEYFQQVLQIRQAVLGEQHPNTAGTLNNIGLVYNYQGQYDRALEYYQQALKIRQAVLGEQHPDTATTLNNIGHAYNNQGQYERALGYYQQALGIWQAVMGEQHPNTATTLGNIGRVYKNQGQYEQALEYYQQTLKVHQAVLGEQHAYTAITLYNIGDVYDSQGQYDRALEYYQQALKIRQAVFGEQHPHTAQSLNSIGRIYDNKGQYDRALKYHQQALKIRQAVLGEQHPDTATTLNSIGDVYNNQGQYERALEYYQQALQIRLTVLGIQHSLTIKTREKVEKLNDLLS